MLTVAPGCELDVERGPGWLLVRIANLNDVVAESVPLADQLWSVLQRHFTYRLVLELDQLQVLNSFLVGQLIQLHQRIEASGGVLRLCGLSPRSRRVMRTCRLAERFPPYRNREEAVMGCRRFRQPK